MLCALAALEVRLYIQSRVLLLVDVVETVGALVPATVSMKHEYARCQMPLGSRCSSKSPRGAEYMFESVSALLPYTLHIVNSYTC
jgi:hypothetical protein